MWGVVEPMAAVVARLYTLPPEEFVAGRDDAVAKARAAGDRAGAAEIAKLRRPTVAAWLVNLLAQQRPDLIAELLELGEALRQAQRNLRGDDIRQLSVRRREMVTELAGQARVLAVAAHRGVRDHLPLADVESTLSAALADPEVAAEVRAGRLIKAVAYAGFGEAPRPQLRLVHGGRSPAGGAAAAGAGTTRRPAADKTARPVPAPGEPASGQGGAKHKGRANGPEVNRQGRPAAGRPVARSGGPAAGRGAGDPAGQTTQAERQADERVADAQRRAAERMAEAQRRAADRVAAAELRRARAAAQRELMAARTQLAEAEAARTAAERAVTQARRRTEKAAAALRRLDEASPAEERAARPDAPGAKPPSA